MSRSKCNFFGQESQLIIKMITSESCLPCTEVVQELASLKGTPDIYFWYEGYKEFKSLPKKGVEFMRDELFKPLYQAKQDITLCLYSLKAWGFTSLRETSDLGEAIASLNNPAVRGVDSSSFFQFCLEQTSGALYDLIQRLLPQKEWLFSLSISKKERNKTVGLFFENQASLLDCLKDLDLARAYSAIQYIEAYYLIRESVQNRLNTGSRRIEIAFVLPNDEGKYYRDLDSDISDMLRADFGEIIEDCTITISFQFFKYGRDKSYRNYMDLSSKATFLLPEDIGSYFTFLRPDAEESSSLATAMTGGM